MMINQVRFSGLASGLDTENIIKNLMSAERMPLNKMLQQKQWQEWQQEAYRETNAKLLDFRNSMEKLRLQSTFTQAKVSSTNASAVDVSRVGNPSLDSYRISVKELAEPARPASVKFKAVDGKIPDANTPFGKVDTSENFEGFKFTLSGGKEGSKPRTIDVVESDTINTVVSKINLLSGDTGVTAHYSEGDRRIVFTSVATGSDAKIEVAGPPTDDGFTHLSKNPLGIVGGKIEYSDGYKQFVHSFDGLVREQDVLFGKDVDPAKVTINGVEIQPTSNTFTYDGMRITLKAENTGPITLNKETDTDAIFNDIKDFVDKYNDVIESLNGKLSEKKFRDFPPLLTEQKEDMKEKEIELWEEKAKSGLLRNDSIISNALTTMRTSLYSTVSVIEKSMVDGNEVETTKTLSVSQFGITTSDDYLENGKLVLDENKLKEAIAHNLDDVKALFAQTSSKDGSTVSNRDKHEESGIGRRIYEQLNESMKELTAKAGSTAKVDNSMLGKSIGRINDQISAFERRLAMVEDRYWKQFTAMEKAIQQANSQSSWLMEQMGGMGM